MIDRRRFLGLMAGLVGQGAVGQVRPQFSDYLGRRALPNDVRPLLAAHGDRLEKAGKERLIFDGSLAEKGGAVGAVRVIFQLPNKLRVQPVAGPGRILTFDGESAASSRQTVDSIDDDLLESLASDSVEGFLDAVSTGQAYRFLGHGFRPDPKAFPNYSGPYFDLYDLHGQVKSRRERPTRAKRFAFDSMTGMLVRVSFQSPQNTLIQTVYSQWGTVDSVPMPGRIERLDGSSTVFSLTRTAASVQGGTDPSPFRLG